MSKSTEQFRPIGVERTRDRFRERSDVCKQCDSKSGRLVGIGRTSVGASSAALALLVPKCPLCVAAWAWALSAAGVNLYRWDAVKLPLTAGLLLLAALLLGFRARPWVTALVLFGSGLCLSLKFAQNSSAMDFVVGVGFSSLVAASYVGIFLWLNPDSTDEPIS